METAIDVTVIAILGLWFCAMLLYVRPHGTKDLSKFGIFGLFIPSWNFFAPTPGVHDYYLLYRDQWQEGGVGVWKEAPGFSKPRRLISAIWNPDKLQKKWLFDVTMALVGEFPKPGTEYDLNLMKLSLPYLMILNYVSSLPGSDFSFARQFMIMRSSAVDDSTEVIFVSGLHKLS